MKVLRLFIFASVLLLLYACTTEPENDYVAYKIKVDSITHPDTVSITDTLIIKFYGTVGPDGCHSFSHFEEHKKTNELELTVWGTKRIRGLCTDVMVFLDGKEYKTLPNKRGLFQIKVIQPDNSFFIDSVYVQ